MGRAMLQSSPSTEAPASSSRASHYAPWADRYLQVRRFTEHLCEPLVTDDYVVQSMPDVSPTKWHLAHTSWFFETFLLQPFAPGYVTFDPRFSYLFNSYYVAVGDRHCRQNRGQLSRPTVAEVYEYRAHVDRQMNRWLSSIGDDPRKLQEVAPLLELGLHHEQQHQELMLTDIKHVFWVNPLRPAYRDHSARPLGTASTALWIGFPEGLHWIGHDGDEFCFDNEAPRHRSFVESFQLGSRLVTNGEYKQFIADGAYQQPGLWLSAGWAAVQQEEWRAPLYWLQQDAQWLNHTLSGLRPVADEEPVCHVSYFEADAFARWAGARLPTEFEWEVASSSVPFTGNLVESLAYHPLAAPNELGVTQMFGDVWEWTASQYTPYPGFKPAEGAVGEYNGKFMCNQFVLRGGSCATSHTHVRPTYRNFFPPDARWQFAGFRLARNV
jgi:ergothioneine biosynthesis protein EgtB